jgi:hypothetical protein
MKSLLGRFVKIQFNDLRNPTDPDSDVEFGFLARKINSLTFNKYNVFYHPKQTEADICSGEFLDLDVKTITTVNELGPITDLPKSVFNYVKAFNWSFGGMPSGIHTSIQGFNTTKSSNSIAPQTIKECNSCKHSNLFQSKCKISNSYISDFKGVCGKWESC